MITPISRCQYAIGLAEVPIQHFDITLYNRFKSTILIKPSLENIRQLHHIQFLLQVAHMYWHTCKNVPRHKAGRCFSPISRIEPVPNTQQLPRILVHCSAMKQPSLLRLNQPGTYMQIYVYLLQNFNSASQDCYLQTPSERIDIFLKSNSGAYTKHLNLCVKQQQSLISYLSQLNLALSFPLKSQCCHWKAIRLPIVTLAKSKLGPPIPLSKYQMACVCAFDKEPFPLGQN